MPLLMCVTQFSLVLLFVIEYEKTSQAVFGLYFFLLYMFYSNCNLLHAVAHFKNSKKKKGNQKGGFYAKANYSEIVIAFVRRLHFVCCYRNH